MDWLDVAMLGVATIFLILGSLFYQTIHLYPSNQAMRLEQLFRIYEESLLGPLNSLAFQEYRSSNQKISVMRDAP